jgi:hypothetical protein
VCGKKSVHLFNRKFGLRKRRHKPDDYITPAQLPLTMPEPFPQETLNPIAVHGQRHLPLGYDQTEPGKVLPVGADLHGDGAAFEAFAVG